MPAPTDPSDGPAPGYQAIARQRIAHARATNAPTLDLRCLGLVELPPEIATLTHLRELRLHNPQWWEDDDVEGPANTLSDLAPLAGLANLQTLYCGQTQVSDLAPLSGLVNLQTLACGETQVSDLAPLAGLANLQTLDCGSTKVSDLTPLAGLANLQRLYCGSTPVSDLTPLAGLATLKSLECRSTQISDLTPLAGVTNLQSLYCGNTQVSDLTPLTGLANLQTLRCWSTKVSDLAPVVGLVNLSDLHCGNTQVNDLTPLTGLAKLQTLACAWIQVSDLTPLVGLGNLQSLDCSRCKLAPVPEALWRSPKLTSVTLFEASLSGILSEILSQSSGDNCLPRLLAHYDDLAAGAEPIRDVKLLLLGNGKAGKTQLRHRLRGEPFNPEWDSTHGVHIATARLDMPGDPEPTSLHIWDFGGQDIYHGTHALFLKSRAIAALVWSTETENADPNPTHGIPFRNHLLQYWADYAAHAVAKGSPALLVQTKCETAAQDSRETRITPETLARLGNPASIHVSSQSGRHLETLKEHLRDAVQTVLGADPEHPPLIGQGRLRAQRKLVQLREADQHLPPDQRRHRTITQQEFRAICAEAGNIAAPKHFLHYLHHAGIVFHREGMFEDRIVLDQAWALDAIYAVLDRAQGSYRIIQGKHGRFTRAELELLVWQGRPRREQEILLSMMRSCGICFIHRAGNDRDHIEPEYIAPDLLPEKPVIQAELDARWPADAAVLTATYTFPLLHQGLIRALIARVGAAAGLNALYWQGGVEFYEATTRSHAIIEQEPTGQWTGHIHLRTTGPGAQDLQSRLAEWIDEEASRAGLTPSARPAPTPESRPAAKEDEPPPPPITITDTPVTEREWCVSYAWADTNPGGEDREKVVDELCAEAERRGLHIFRDKTTLRTGESISAFVRRIGRAERILVVLSAKYMKSVWCMTELHEIWRNSRHEPDEFRKRVRVFALPDAKIDHLSDRLAHANHWADEHNAIKALINHAGDATRLGLTGFQEYTYMRDFADHTAEILAAMSSIVRPVTIDQLKDYFFRD